MVKMVSLSDEAYCKLKRIKNNDSFSEVILKLLGRPEKKTLLDLVSSWERDEELAKNIEKAYRGRKRAKLKEVKL